MTDVTPWKKIKDPNFLGAWDLITGATDTGEPIFGQVSLTIKSIQNEEVIDLQKSKGKEVYKKVVTAKFTNSKPMILNVTNMKAIEKVLKTPFIEHWVGKQIVVGVDKVKAFGDIHDALRVKNYIPKPPKTYTCTNCGAQTSEDMAVRTEKAFGVILCKECGLKRNEEIQQQAKTEENTETESDVPDNNVGNIPEEEGAE